MSNNTERELLLNLHEKMDLVKDKLNDIQIVQVKQQASLDEHIKRTGLAEERIEFLEDDIKPLLQGASFLKTIAKLVTGLVTFSYAISKIFFR